MFLDIEAVIETSDWKRRARTAHEGTSLRSWAPTRAREAATARTEAWKRMFADLKTGELFGVVDGRSEDGEAKGKKKGWNYK